MQIDAGGILDMAMAGTSATLLARKWESALLVNVDNDTLRRVLDNAEAMAAVERIEGEEWHAEGLPAPGEEDGEGREDDGRRPPRT